MKLIYCSSIGIPSNLANRFQTLSMAAAFNKILGNSFYFGLSYIGEKGSEKYLKYLKHLGKNRLLVFGRAKSYWLALKYVRLIKKEKIRYVYCREPHLLLFLIFWSKFFFLNPIFFYEAHIPPKNFLEKIIHKILFKQANYFGFITQYVQDFYIKNYKCPANKAVLIPDGVDLDIFDIELSKEKARQKLNLPIDKKILGYFGKLKTMGMEKGIETVLQALKKLNNNILFLAVGGRLHNRRYYQDIAEKLGVHNKVLFLDHHIQREVAVFQKACDVLLMPFPYNEHYAFYMSPMKMFEYMASKRPIISSDLPSLREILSEKSAFFFKPGNARHLAETIEKVLTSPEIAEKIAQQAFQDVRRYTWQERVKNIVARL